MTEDTVNQAWLDRHGIIKAPGLVESDTAWIKVDCAGRITHAGLKDQSILSLLIERRVLDEGAHADGNTYLDWREAFLARVSGARYSQEPGGSSTGDWTKESRFGFLNTEKNRHRIRYIEIAMASNPLPRELGAIKDAETLRKFREAFEWLHEQIAAVYRMADDAKKTTA